MIREVTSAIKRKKPVEPIVIPHDHGQSLRVACAIFGVGTAEMAREFGVTASAIDKWKATPRWNRERVDNVADFFGMSTNSFEGLEYRALSESVNSDAVALMEHLVKYHPDKSDQAAQIKRQYNKIVHLLREIEGVA